MKKIFTLKKAAVIAVAICLLLPAAAFAVGHISSYVSHSDSRDAYTVMPTANELTQELGFVPKTIDAFDNGFSFEKAYIVNTKGLDDNDATVEEFKEIDYSYKAADGQKINLSISKPPVQEEPVNDPNAQITTFNGIDLTYSAQNYRFVPPDYQLTEEDKAAEASGEVVFSYGSDEVTDSAMQFLSWSDAGINYLLLAQDTNLTQDDFINMAKEIINQ